MLPRRGPRREDRRSCSTSGPASPNLERWERVVEAREEPRAHACAIAMVGKYVDLTESYKSLNEALTHARHRAPSAAVDDRVRRLREARATPALARRRRRHPRAARLRLARRRGQDRARSATRASSTIPYFGICYGMQMAVIEFARHVAGLAGANSTEVDPETPHPVIDLLPEQRARRREGRDDAARRVSVRARAGHQRLRAPTARARSPSATATATR